MRSFGRPIVNFAPEGAHDGGAAGAGGAAPDAGAGGAQTPSRPEWLPESHWDTAANTIKPEFGQHYSEISTFHKTETERLAALPQKVEDYKLNPIIPEGVKVPEGMQVKIDPKNPVVTSMLALAVKHRIPQEVVNDWIADDIRMKVASHDAETQRIQAGDAKLGANAKARKDAVDGWLTGMRDRKELEPQEYEAVRVYAIDPEAVTALEKIMAKAAGNVPGHHPGNPPKPPEKTVAERWYSGTQQKAS